MLDGSMVLSTAILFPREAAVLFCCLINLATNKFICEVEIRLKQHYSAYFVHFNAAAPFLSSTSVPRFQRENAFPPLNGIVVNVTSKIEMAGM